MKLITKIENGTELTLCEKSTRHSEIDDYYLSDVWIDVRNVRLDRCGCYIDTKNNRFWPLYQIA